MKFYRVLDMTLRKYDGKKVDYKVGAFGTSGGVMTDLNECASIVKNEKKRFLSYSYGVVTILKDEILEFQAREIDGKDSETIYSVKVVEIDINIEQE